ncbi:MAG: hypothetical protein NTU53_11990 [Planctomycetota bacterium]|nr:hypothetical protein [Planctomycetota bacterium]
MSDANDPILVAAATLTRVAEHLDALLKSVRGAIRALAAPDAPATDDRAGTEQVQVDRDGTARSGSFGKRSDEKPFAKPTPSTPLEALTERDDLRRRLDIFEQWDRAKGVLTARQWIAVCQRFRDGKTQEQVGAAMGTKRNAIYGLLKRARYNKEDYERQLRKEQHQLARGAMRDDV